MPPVPLSRTYPSILAAPLINAVDPQIFALRYFTHCMQCGFCNDTCCSYGVHIDEANVERLRGLGADFSVRVPTPAGEWFDDEDWEDADFPSGRVRRTNVRDGRCVFLNRKARGCLIHSYCLDKGLDYHDYKPLISVLFPVTFHEGCLLASRETADGSLICSGDGPTLYEGSRGELAHYFGAGLVQELDAISARWTQ